MIEGVREKYKMVEFVCKNCGYKLEDKEGQRRCPYCSIDRLEEEQDAEKLIKDVEKILE